MRRIKARTRHHRQHIAGQRVEHDTGEALLDGAALHDEFLQRGVKAEHDLAARLSRRCGDLADDAAEGVDLDLARAGTAAQLWVQRLFDAVLADAEIR